MFAILVFFITKLLYNLFEPSLNVDVIFIPLTICLCYVLSLVRHLFTVLSFLSFSLFFFLSFLLPAEPFL